MPILPMKKGEVHTFIRLIFTIAHLSLGISDITKS